MRNSVFVILAAALFGPLASAQPGGGTGPACSASDAYICGQRGPEDLVAMGSDWAVASAYAQPGGVTLIRISDRMSYTAYPSAGAEQQLDADSYPDCPGPPDTSNFTTHGVYVAPGAGPEHRLFVVGHGAREAIEIFNVDTRGNMPSLTWIGCVIAPEPIGLNSVRSLPDGGFLTTNFNPRGSDMAVMMTGVQNGELWEWHKDSGWVKIPGSEASGANGVELSDDGETVYIAAWGNQKFIRLSRGRTPVQRDEIDLGFRIDNIHWARDGRLISAGQVNQDWQIVMIDPDTLETEQIYQQAAMPGFQGGTVALEVGDAIWVGSYTGDRIAIIPAPAAAGDWQTIAETSTVTMYATKQEKWFDGTFADFSAKITFDPSNPAAGRIIGNVMTDSIETGDPQNNGYVRQYLEVDKFPEAHFESASIEPVDDYFHATGELTLVGQTKPAVLDFSFEVDDGAGSGQRAKFSGQIRLNRLDWGIAADVDPGWTGEEVVVQVELELEGM